MAVLCAPVALLVTVIDAPGIRAPLSSRPTPTILPVVSSYARKVMPVINRVRTTAREILVDRFMFPPFAILEGKARFSSDTKTAVSAFKGEKLRQRKIPLRGIQN